MTDNEIIKVLECHSRKSGKTLNCCDCAYFSMEYCSQIMAGHALDLINRLKAENERVKKANEGYAELEQGCFVTGYKNIRAEAIKEFAERLTNKADLINVNYFESKWAISDNDIDDLIEEMVGEDNG